MSPGMAGFGWAGLAKNRPVREPSPQPLENPQPDLPQSPEIQNILVLTIAPIRTKMRVMFTKSNVRINLDHKSCFTYSVSYDILS
jgi:hypothetical protein